MHKNSLTAFLNQHVSKPKTAKVSDFPAAFEARGRVCPTDLANLPDSTKIGYFPEQDFARWQVLTPAEVQHPGIPLPGIEPASTPIVHCYDNTYLVIAADGTVRMWDAVDDLDFEEWPSLHAALRSHLQQE